MLRKTAFYVAFPAVKMAVKYSLFFVAAAGVFRCWRFIQRGGGCSDVSRPFPLIRPYLRKSAFSAVGVSAVSSIEKRGVFPTKIHK